MSLKPWCRVTMHLAVASVNVIESSKGWNSGTKVEAIAIVGDEHGCFELFIKNE